MRHSFAQKGTVEKNGYVDLTLKQRELSFSETRSHFILSCLKGVRNTFGVSLRQVTLLGHFFLFFA